MSRCKPIILHAQQFNNVSSLHKISEHVCFDVNPIVQRNTWQVIFQVVIQKIPEHTCFSSQTNLFNFCLLSVIGQLRNHVTVFSKIVFAVIQYAETILCYFQGVFCSTIPIMVLVLAVALALYPFLSRVGTSS